MAKQVAGLVKLQCPGGSATPATPVRPALCAHGVNIRQFVKQINGKTATHDLKGLMLPVVITVYSDRTFEFKIKSPPPAVLIKLAAKLPAGRKQGKVVIHAEGMKRGKYKGFSLTKTQVEEIAKKKLQDLHARDL